MSRRRRGVPGAVACPQISRRRCAMSMPKIRILAGASLIAAGARWWLGARVGLAPGRLPGDVTFELGGATVYLPLGTCLVLSALLSLLLWVIGR